MARFNWKPYYDEIKELIEQGLSPGKSIKILQERHGDIFPDSGKRQIHHIIKNQFAETLSDNNFTPPDNWSHGWLKTKEASIFVKNMDASGVSFDTMREDFIAEMKQHAPTFVPIKREPIKDSHLLVIDVADLHIGKLAGESETGDPYNVDIAIQRATEGVSGILNKAQGFTIDKIVFVIGNDVLHTDNTISTTTRGTVQDTDGMWYDNYVRARKLYTSIIGSLVTIADIHVIHCPSNHDYVTGFMLADSVMSFFHNHPNITFDVSMAHRKYYQYGRNLIGATHGDCAKSKDLPLLMANEAKKEWADTYFRYFYLHHIHHKIKVQFVSGHDYQGATVESTRSPSSADSYHHKHGFQHTPKAIEGFIHHKEWGQVSRITHYFR